MDLWKSCKIADGQCLKFQIGPLHLWFHRQVDELLVAFERLEEIKMEKQRNGLTEIKEELSPDLSWSRWIIGKDQCEVKLVPMMPDRPVVVRPGSQVIVPQGKEAVFFVSIPIWIKLHIIGPGEYSLTEIPIVVLSNIWFGDPMSGELCYSLRTRARRSISDSEVSPYSAVCPVKIKNASDAQLDFQRLCIHVQHLKIFDSEYQLWTNEVKTTFRGEDKDSQIDYLKKPPTYQKVGEVVSTPRTPLTASLLKKSFSSLRAFSGI